LGRLDFALGVFFFVFMPHPFAHEI